MQPSGPGITVVEPSEIGGALERAFAADRPVVIDVKAAVDGIAPRAWTPE